VSVAEVQFGMDWGASKPEVVIVIVRDGAVVWSGTRAEYVAKTAPLMRLGGKPMMTLELALGVLKAASEYAADQIREVTRGLDLCERLCPPEEPPPARALPPWRGEHWRRERRRR
jgi:hypothetical protein